MTELSKEYGTALFMLAYERNEQKSYAEVLEKIKNTFLANPQYVELLSSPSISLKDRLQMINDAFSSTAPEYILSYLKLLCEKGRMGYFIESVDAYKELLDASERISSAKITSAVALSDTEKDKLIERLERAGKGKIKAEYFVDEALLGGVIVEINGEIMDGSLRHRLQDIKEVMNS